MGTFYIAPKIGAMGNIRLSIHSFEHSWLRDFLLKRRKELGLSQRALGMKMGVVHSFIGKVETGDRRLDIFEFITYCRALELDPGEVIREIQELK
ncbi:helix-turn-helix transcriptional regulator [Bisgaard Taxon 10/6]|uniref:Helix-turn-helix transcriptional regulator n=2 Tax=Exercitatus varius TaxID=67857 RepID=A0ABT6ENU8_9PAST|nr:helix-turn-helix transcriptional regulator [Exercitatus varius]MDG2916013.1 helix-turn-helix transcriptional regulator [Exercitatus varius]MDG2917066.1 helix-turn-helix transcriptional regulator [Exercitatus varius]MDG2940113.1 helix-turn-helix transcriptional regulator [Exercitatus varius]MDG2940796.1 helix-turn-helix transcriptional regulator [Exercitatus varius]MDG2945216.1 helix-turn-helix transcriptional regulator [Exercitatus varius]